VIEETSSNEDQRKDKKKPTETLPISVSEAPTSTPLTPSVQPRSSPNQSVSRVASKAATQNEQDALEVEGKIMGPFERKMVLLTIIGIGLAAITAALFYVQLREMTSQTQILASQSEGANSGALMDEMNTRKQLSIVQEQADAAQKQGKAAQDQVETLRHNFIKEQQPYLWFTNETAILDWTEWEGGTASWTYHITNYGKSPAVNYSVDRHTETGPDALKKIKEYKISRQLWSWKGSRLPQGKDDYFTSYVKISGKDWQQAKANDQWIVTVGTFIYYDLAGFPHADDFCVSYFANGSVTYCEYKRKTQ
jgi:hypothetical protein